MTELVNGSLEDELERANKEREEIVRKYFIGRSLDNQINHWVSIDDKRNCYIVDTMVSMITDRKIQTLASTIKLIGKTCC
jgi:hypothetical protein